MDKISSIIPKSNRITSTVIENERPVRPGAPGFGRPEGSSALKDRISLSAIDRIENAKQDILEKQERARLELEGINRLAEAFFGRAKEAPKTQTPSSNAVNELPVTIVYVNEIPAGDQKVEAPVDFESEGSSEASMAPPAVDEMPVAEMAGQRLDVMA